MQGTNSDDFKGKIKNHWFIQDVADDWSDGVFGTEDEEYHTVKYKEGSNVIFKVILAPLTLICFYYSIKPMLKLLMKAYESIKKFCCCDKENVKKEAEEDDKRA